MNKSLSGRRALIVEDEMMVLMNIEYMLADMGCATIFAASTVESALEIVATEGVDFAILDVNLEGRPSYVIADALVPRSIPFVFSTGYGHNRIEVRFADRPVVKKPYSENDLSAALTRLLRAAPPGPDASA